MNNKKESKAVPNDWDQLSPMYQRRIKWTLKIAGAWLTFVLAGAGIFVLYKPYMDRKRKERIKSGEFIEYLYGGSPQKIGRSWEQSALKFSPKKNLQSDLSPPDYLADIILEEEQNQQFK